MSCSESDFAQLQQMGERLAAGDRVLRKFLARRYLRVRDRSGNHVPLKPNRVQLEFEAKRGPRNIVLKARQMGISTWVSGQFFLKTITCPGTLTVQVAHTQEAAESIFRIVHRFYECLPPQFRDGILKTSRSNIRQIAFPMLDSEYRVESAADPNAGRGLTINNLHCSELARWSREPAETLQGLCAAVPKGGEIVLESTPMGAGGCFWQEWQESESTGTVRHFFPWWWEPSYTGTAVCESTLDEAERRLMQEHNLTHAQIGFRRQLLANFRGLAKQEYAENASDCFLSSGDCVFDKDAINIREREVNEPFAKRLGGQLQIWYPPVPGRKYLVAVDPAGGGSEGDYSAVQVIELETSLQCAEIRSKIGGLDLAQEVAKLAAEYNQALVVVERNNHGTGILAYLTGVCRYMHLYGQGGQQGWLTSTLSRPRMIGLLGAALVESPRIFSSSRLLRECRTFVRHRNGNIAAQFGEHDDCVMSMAMAIAVRSELVAAG
ncbi:terminase [Silvibacterium acidisoli]|uniref:terminase n=1 Tax=Acidobacteriaceae bacterium ZG23-2 TaxID=2883246 RepID=UPI00406CD7BB